MGDFENAALDEVAFAVIGVEGAALGAAAGSATEVACVKVRNGREIQAFSSFVDVGRETAAGAAAGHELTGGAASRHPSFEAIGPVLETLCGDAVVVSDNAASDLKLLPILGRRPSLCTLRLARRCFPELDGYANQLLRYAFGTAPSGTKQPRRALEDARVTAAVLGVLLRRYVELGHAATIDALLEFAATPIPLKSLPFGEYRGKPLTQVPASYLQWIRRRNARFDAQIQEGVRAELERRGLATAG